MNSTRLVAVIVVFAALLLGACSDVRNTEDRIEDAAVTAMVKTRLAADPEVNPFEIDVDTWDGVVTLRGLVGDAEARTEAEELARETDGVVRVVNELELGGKTAGEGVDDQVIIGRINAALLAGEINPVDIDVDAIKGQVILSGTVDDEQERSRAEEIARRTEGVQSVDNRLEVLASAALEDDGEV